MRKKSWSIPCYLLGASLLILIFSCKKADVNALGNSAQFNPPSEVLLAGIVHKYYIYSINKQEEKTIDIQYIKEQLANDTLFVEVYNAGFELEYKRKIYISDNQYKLVSDQYYSRFYGITEGKIHDDSFRDWRNTIENTNLSYAYDFGINTNVISRKLISRIDSTIDGNPAKVFHYEGQTIRNRVNSIDTAIHRRTVIYLQNTGYYGGKFTSANYNSRTELVEQMAIGDFEVLRVNAPKRVAYIERNTAMLVDSTFTLCDPDGYIYDYYNGDPDGHLVGRQGEMWRFTKGFMDTSSVDNESGLLSIRFILNCKGEIDYFASEQSDLNYQPYEFSQKTVDQFIAITKSMKPWKATNVRGENVDSYTYILYKIKNGKVVEILP